jgi:hypothetical protein
MMNKKTIIGVIAVAVVAAVVYFYYMGHSKPEDVGSLAIQNDPEVQASAARVLVLLNQIKSINIDPKFFTSAEYQTLVDYSVVIPPLPVGRPNPFAPLPGSAVVVPTPTRTPATTRR